MKLIKIVTMIGTRPEIIRMSETIKRLDSNPNFEHILIHTGQNYDYELNQIFFDDLNLRAPDVFLDAAGPSAASTIGKVLIKLDEWLEINPIDAFLLLGDTNSGLGALAAKKRKIPVFHCEAGNRSFDERVPEEINRRIIDHFADINLPYSNHAKSNLIFEGLSEKSIILTGSPMKEVFHANKHRIEESRILSDYKLKSKKYFLVSAHREENVSNKIEFLKLTNTLNQVAESYRYPIIVTTHPRTRKEFDASGILLNPLIQLLKPLNYSDYIQLQLNAFCVLSDSGTISEECAILGFPAVNIRYSQERPEAYEIGVLPLVGLEFNDVLKGIKLVTERLEAPPTPIDYQSANFSERVINVLISNLNNKEVL